MKKALALVFAVTLILSLAACSNNDIPDEPPEIDMTQTVTQEELEQIDFENADYVTAEDGERLVSTGRIQADDDTAAETEAKEVSLSTRTTLTPDEFQNTSAAAYSGTGNFTMPEAAEMADGSLGKLSIPKIGLDVSIYETDSEMEDMAHGVAHFKETSCWDGNVGLAGHNQGVNTFFGQIHTLDIGDNITLTTALGTRSYKVATKVEISEDDWSFLGRADNNVITLITCVNHDLTKRLCLQAIEA